MAAFSQSHKAYDGTYGGDTTGLYLFDINGTSGNYFAFSSGSPEPPGYWYDGKKYKTKKLALQAKNKDLSQEQTFFMRFDDFPLAKLYPNGYNYRYKPVTALSRRQKAYQKRKARLHGRT